MKKIAVLEDMEDVLTALRKRLSKLDGWETIYFQSVRDALRHQDEIAAADVILLDRDDYGPDGNQMDSFHRAMPERWQGRVISISMVPEWNWQAREAFGATICQKEFEDLPRWAEQVAVAICHRAAPTLRR